MTLINSCHYSTFNRTVVVSNYYEFSGGTGSMIASNAGQSSLRGESIHDAGNCDCLFYTEFLTHSASHTFTFVHQGDKIIPVGFRIRVERDGIERTDEHTAFTTGTFIGRYYCFWYFFRFYTLNKIVSGINNRRKRTVFTAHSTINT